jgi:hypothetical protein
LHVAIKDRNLQKNSPLIEFLKHPDLGGFLEIFFFRVNFGFSDKVKVSSTKQFKNDWDKLIKINVDQPINLEVERI